MLAILLLAAEKSRVTFQAPLPIGLALFIGQLASGAFLFLNVRESVSLSLSSNPHTVYWTGGSLK